ncbi:Uncharacterized membrane protein YjjP, DUF1212 family [Sanguibacter gelidistatuariae]|uniref:Uncharacterized membrane protein YjjP, DUF1212 family n=1 Tax=Sanguibacter gelidistatuariae TaxID=1814289 RepID=A0A1G6XP80_9MICO|nr:Uncharacterized membrane protein YjjP, DUF1212 family [Sanguibacter gelidistatuariae]
MLAVAAAGLVVCGPLAEASSALPRSAVVDVPITPTPTSEPDGSGLGEAVPGEPVDPTTPPVPDSTEAPGDLDSGGPGAPGESAEPGAPDQTPKSPVSEEPVDPTPGSDDATPEETEDPAAPEAPVLDPIPPAASDTSRSAASWIIAIAVLAMSGLLLVALRRRALHASPEQVPDAAYGWPPDAPHAPSAAVTFTAIEAVGEAMLDATYSVITIEAALEDIARANAYPATEVVVLPTALFVSTRGGGELHTGAISSGRHKLLLHQVDALDHLVRAARAGEVDPAQILQRVGEIRTAPPPFSRLVRIAAYALLCAGIAVILGASLVGIAVAGVLGGFVGTARLLSAEVSRQREPLVTVALAFGVSTAVFLLARAGWDPGVLPSLIAPLVILLPGALLTTGIIELSAGQMMSGAGRLMAGFMQLTLLSVGIVAGAALVGVPQIVLSEAHHPIGPAGPWIAVAAFGVGVVVHQGGRRDSIPWILLVLYVAYGAQVIGDIFFGGVLSALIGAFVMTPVAVLVSRHPSGPAAAVSFLPAFWLLVPGALGLVGVTALLGGDGDGMSTVVTTLSTMVAIALGILAGSALSSSSRSPRGDVL